MAQVFYIWRTGGIPQDVSNVESVRFTLTTSGPHNWEIGFGFIGRMFATSSNFKLTKNTTTTTASRGRQEMTIGGGPSYSSVVNPTELALESAKMDEDDREVMNALFERVDVSLPFFFLSQPTIDVQPSRATEGGLVRFATNSMKVQPVGPATQKFFKFSSTLTPWR
jgi:hypothetical protein